MCYCVCVLMCVCVYLGMHFVLIYIYIYIQSTPDKSDSKGTGKSIRLSEISDLSEIQNDMQIRHEMRSVS